MPNTSIQVEDVICLLLFGVLYLKEVIFSQKQYCKLNPLHNSTYATNISRLRFSFLCSSYIISFFKLKRRFYLNGNLNLATSSGFDDEESLTFIHLRSEIVYNG